MCVRACVCVCERERGERVQKGLTRWCVAMSLQLYYCISNVRNVRYRNIEAMMHTSPL